MFPTTLYALVVVTLCNLYLCFSIMFCHIYILATCSDCNLDCMVVRGGGSGAGGGCTGGCCPCSSGTYTGDAFCNLYCVVVAVVAVVAFQQRVQLLYMHWWVLPCVTCTGGVFPRMFYRMYVLATQIQIVT